MSFIFPPSLGSSSDISKALNLLTMEISSSGSSESSSFFFFDSFFLKESWLIWLG